MKTLNVISTPEITGNISSCETKSIVVRSGRESVWFENYVTVTTNNCSGKTTEYGTWGFTPFSFVFGVFFVFLLWVTIAIIGESSDH